MDIILSDYFQILPQNYFLLFISMGISAILIHELYSFFDN